MNQDKTEQAENSVSRIGKFNTADDLLFAYNALESEFTKRCQLIKQLQTRLDELSAQAAASPARQEDEAPHSEAAEATAEDFVSADSVADINGGTLSEQVKEATDDKPDRAVGSVVCADALPVASNINAPLTESAKTAEDVLDEIAMHAEEYADILSAIPEVMNTCIARYKHRLLEIRSGRGASPAGMAVILPAKRPRSLYEAKLIADDMLK